MGDQSPQKGAAQLHLTSLVASTAECVEELLAINLEGQVLLDLMTQ